MALLKVTASMRSGAIDHALTARAKLSMIVVVFPDPGPGSAMVSAPCSMVGTLVCFVEALIRDLLLVMI
jgi:hypothetical protein